MIQTKNLIRVDFICALSGALIYFLFFDFLLNTLELPHWIASTQLAANTIYGIFGVFVYLKAPQLFKVLAMANFAYAIFCIGLSVTLFAAGKTNAGLLLVLEGHFVLILAKVEHSVL